MFGLSQDVYNVEQIVDKKKKNGKTFYLIKWEGYPDSGMIIIGSALLPSIQFFSAAKRNITIALLLL